MVWEIYEEGYQCNGDSGKATYLGEAEGKTFIDACRNFIKQGNRGEIRRDKHGYYACDWGCRWYPTYEEASRNYG